MTVKCRRISALPDTPVTEGLETEGSDKVLSLASSLYGLPLTASITLDNIANTIRNTPASERVTVVNAKFSYTLDGVLYIVDNSGNVWRSTEAGFEDTGQDVSTQFSDATVVNGVVEYLTAGSEYRGLPIVVAIASDITTGILYAATGDRLLHRYNSANNTWTALGRIQQFINGLSANDGNFIARSQGRSYSFALADLTIQVTANHRYTTVTTEITGQTTTSVRTQTPTATLGTTLVESGRRKVESSDYDGVTTRTSQTDTGWTDTLYRVGNTTEIDAYAVIPANSFGIPTYLTGYDFFTWIPIIRRGAQIVQSPDEASRTPGRYTFRSRTGSVTGVVHRITHSIRQTRRVVTTIVADEQPPVTSYPTTAMTLLPDAFTTFGLQTSEVQITEFETEFPEGTDRHEVTVTHDGTRYLSELYLDTRLPVTTSLSLRITLDPGATTATGVLGNAMVTIPALDEEVTATQLTAMSGSTELFRVYLYEFNNTYWLYAPEATAQTALTTDLQWLLVADYASEDAVTLFALQGNGNRINLRIRNPATGTPVAVSNWTPAELDGARVLLALNSANTIFGSEALGKIAQVTLSVTLRNGQRFADSERVFLTGDNQLRVRRCAFYGAEIEGSRNTAIFAVMDDRLFDDFLPIRSLDGGGVSISQGAEAGIYSFAPSTTFQLTLLDSDKRILRNEVDYEGVLVAISDITTANAVTIGTGRIVDITQRSDTGVSKPQAQVVDTNLDLQNVYPIASASNENVAAFLKRVFADIPWVNINGTTTQTITCSYNGSKTALTMLSEVLSAIDGYGYCSEEGTIEVYLTQPDLATPILMLSDDGRADTLKVIREFSIRQNRADQVSAIAVSWNA